MESNGFHVPLKMVQYSLNCFLKFHRESSESGSNRIRAENKKNDSECERQRERERDWEKCILETKFPVWFAALIQSFARLPISEKRNNEKTKATHYTSLSEGANALYNLSSLYSPWLQNGKNIRRHMYRIWKSDAEMVYSTFCVEMNWISLWVRCMCVCVCVCAHICVQVTIEFDFCTFCGKLSHANVTASHKEQNTYTRTHGRIKIERRDRTRTANTMK